MTVQQTAVSKYPIINYHFIDVKQDYEHYDADRANFQRIYGNLVSKEPSLGGRVLDIGCGHGVNPSFQYFQAHIGQLDGVDPFPVMEPPHHLANRWTCGVEEIPVANETYDMAFSYNVIEHVEEIDPFLTKVVELLKPGACYWSMSPNYNHPFAFITRAVQRLGLLGAYRRNVNNSANDYPAFYRVSSDKNVIHTIRSLGLPVAKVDFYYIPNVQWDHYFPKMLRFVAKFIDKNILLKLPRHSFIFMVRIEKQG